MKIAFCSSEVYPFAKTGGLADVVGALPIALEKLGEEIAVFMPGYRAVAKAGLPIEALNAEVSRSKTGSNIHVYFIDHPGFFDRESIYGDETGDYPDNLKRFSYYCDRTMRLWREIDFKPHVVHCHDWQTGLIPVYLKRKYGDDPFYQGIKSLLTIHNLAFQGVFPKEDFSVTGLDGAMFESGGFEYYGKANLLKSGIIHADRVSTVSPQYAKEIRSKEFGCGLDGVIRVRRDGVIGIINGLDTDVWDPGKDHYIARTYSKEDFGPAKEKNKIQLQKEIGLETSGDRPLMAFVGRLSHQKGVDVIIASADKLIAMGAQLVFLGKDENGHQEELEDLAAKYPGLIAARHTFNEELGHQIYAGSDFFLMPSRFEPCGLSQLISLSYGTIPIVCRTGGLADTVKPFGLWDQSGNGVVFKRNTAESFLNAVKHALDIFKDKEKFAHIRRNAMNARFSWNRSAKKYQDLYRCL